MSRDNTTTSVFAELAAAKSRLALYFVPCVYVRECLFLSVIWCFLAAAPCQPSVNVFILFIHFISQNFISS